MSEPNPTGKSSSAAQPPVKPVVRRPASQAAAKNGAPAPAAPLQPQNPAPQPAAAPPPTSEAKKWADALAKKAASSGDPLAALVASISADMLGANDHIQRSAEKVRRTLEARPQEELKLDCLTVRQQTALWSQNLQYLRFLDTVQERNREPLRRFSRAADPPDAPPAQ